MGRLAWAQLWSELELKDGALSPPRANVSGCMWCRDGEPGPLCPLARRGSPRRGEVRRADMLTCAIPLPSPAVPVVLHTCPAHKYLILCSCQPPLIGLMLPEEQPKAALVADV